MLLGNLGRDPDVRFNADGAVTIASFSLATTRRYRSSEGEPVSETEWHRVVLFGRHAELARDYLKRGSPLFVEGRLRTRKWTDQSGNERYSTEIVGENIQLLGSRTDAPQSQSQPSGGFAHDGFESAPRQTSSYARPAAPVQQPAPAAQPDSIDSLDDDVPF